MLIEKIQSVNGSRSKVYLDTGESFVLYNGELRILKLKENTELPESVYKQIKEAVLPKRAKLRTMNLLKVKPYTEYNLRKKLIEGGYPGDVIDIAIDYVKSFGYINDRQYAIDYITQDKDRHTKKEIYLKLSQKGIAKETLDSAFNELYGSFSESRSESSFNESELVLKTLKKRGFSGNETYEEKQKLLAYFYRRGFDMDTVFSAMNSIKDE